MREDNRAYLERRVTEELHRAASGGCAEAVRAHYQLLGHYLDRLYAIEDEAEEDEVEDELVDLPI